MLHIEGEVLAYRVGESTAPLDRQHAVLVNQHALHGNVAMGEGRSVVLMLYLSPQWVAAQFPAAPPGALFPSASVAMPDGLRRLADELAQCMRHAGDIDDAQVQQLFGTLAVELCTVHGRARPWMRPGNPNDFRIRRAIALMHECIDEPLSACELSSRVGLSRSRFFELFAACTGLSPKHYANMLRLDRATQWLVGHDGPIAEVSYMCGFGAQSHFSKFFVEQQGFTPREFRRAAAPLLASGGSR